MVFASLIRRAGYAACLCMLSSEPLAALFDPLELSVHSFRATQTFVPRLVGWKVFMIQRVDPFSPSFSTGFRSLSFCYVLRFFPCKA